MFVAKFENKKVINGVISTIALLVDEVNLIAEDTGLSINAIDPSHTCFIFLKLGQDVMIEYEKTGTTVENAFSIRLRDLAAILKRAKPTDHVSLGGENNIINVGLTPERGKRERIFKLGCSEILPDVINRDLLDKLEYTSDLVINSDVFTEAVNDALIVSDFMVIETKESGDMALSAWGVVGDIDYEIDGEEIIWNNGLGDSAKAFLTISYLSRFIKVSSISVSVRLYIGDDIPLKLTYVFDDAQESTLTFYLAPRVDLDERTEITERRKVEFKQTEPRMKTEKEMAEIAAAAEAADEDEDDEDDEE